MKQFISLIKIEFKRIFSNGVLMAIFFGAPLVYGLLFGTVYKQAKVTGLPIVIVDQDHSPLSDKIIDAFRDNPALIVSKVQYDKANIQSLMPTKQYVAIITIPEHFEADIFQKKHPEINVDLDMVNLLNAKTASKHIQTVLLTLNAGFEIEGLKKQGLNPKQALDSYESFKINYNKLYNTTGNYLIFMLPGLLAAIMQQIIFLALALVFARDFEDGYFNKLIKISKNALYQVFLKFVPFLILIPIVWLMIAYFIRLFHIDVPIFNVNIIYLTILFSFASMFIGMLFSVLIPSQLKATELLMVISTPAFILSGFTWPSFAIPKPIAVFAEYIPLTQYLNGFKKIAFYKGNISDIHHEISMLWLITFVSFILIVLALQIKIYLKTRKKTASS